MGLIDRPVHNVSVVKNKRNGINALAVNMDGCQNSFSAEYIANQTSLTVITPESGHRICVHGVFCSTEAASGTISLDFATSAKPVFRLYTTKTQAKSQSTMNVSGAIDEVLMLNTTTGDNNVFVLVNYMIEE